MNNYDSRPETQAHIDRVSYFVNMAAENLIERARRHDASKLVSPEVEAFDIGTPKLASLEYGSAEYKESLRELGPALQHHFENNDHHPEWGDRNIEWREVVGFPDYEVSNMGDVRSRTREVDRPGPQGNMIVNSAIRSAHVTPKGYARLQLRRDGKPTNRFVHTLVAEAFLPNPEEKPEVNHKNGVKTDNRLSNLEWVTASENQVHAYETGLKEAAVKWVYHCPELDITTFGSEKMARLVREAGHPKVTAAGVWAASERGGQHYDLTFEATALVEYRRSQIQGMSLMALIEMLCDWRAASERVKQRADDPEKVKTFESGLAFNQERFGYSDELAQILRNTIAELGL